MRRTTTNDNQRRRDARVATHPATAETRDRALFALLATGSLLLILALLFAAPGASAEPASPAPLPETQGLEAPIEVVTPIELETLLLVPGHPAAPLVAAHATDASISDAVARGTADHYTHPSGFRKRSLDLFRAERPVSIDGQDMLIRLRLRPKRRETMSVELRF